MGIGVYTRALRAMLPRKPHVALDIGKASPAEYQEKRRLAASCVQVRWRLHRLQRKQRESRGALNLSEAYVAKELLKLSFLQHRLKAPIKRSSREGGKSQRLAAAPPPGPSVAADSQSLDADNVSI